MWMLGDIGRAGTGRLGVGGIPSGVHVEPVRLLRSEPQEARRGATLAVIELSARRKCIPSVSVRLIV
jgi:hypothetical protein